MNRLTRRMQTIVCFAVLLIGSSLIKAQALQSTAGQVPTAKQVEQLLKNQPKTYAAHYAAGQLYESQGFYGQAQDEFRQALSFPPVKPDAYKRLAQLALKSSDYATAEKVATDGLHLFPKDYGMLLTAGYVLHNQNKLPAALNMYQRARAARPQDAQICLAIADVLAAMNKPEQALQEMARFDKVSQPTTLSIYEKAKILLALKRYDQALAELDKNFNQDPANFANNKLYASTLANQGNRLKALEVALCLLANANGKEMEMSKQRVTNLLGPMPEGVPPNVIAKAEGRIKDLRVKARMHFALGDVYDRKSQFDFAIKQYQAGLKLDPLFARGHYRLGLDLEKHSKDLKAASASFKKAHELNSGKDQQIEEKWKLLRSGSH
ncbi:MAG: tetratricopeptide repeat protein [Candidatus Obscuribacterales bacterium]